MNILFLSIGELTNLDNRGIYTDLLRKFRDEGHCVYVACPSERRTGRNTEMREESGIHVLRIRTGNITKVNLLEKGLSTLSIEPLFKHGIQKYMADVRFDLVFYSTPPVTFGSVIAYVKKRDGAASYLMLKDIFPQNAIDLGMFSDNSLIARYFKQKEIALYRVSDRIGCMTPANREYLLKHQPWLLPAQVGICRNALAPYDGRINAEQKEEVRRAHGLPLDQKILIYGGNFGRPQDIGFMIRCLQSVPKTLGVFFLLIGSGTEYGRLSAYIENEKPPHVRLMSAQPKEIYEKLVGASDVGLVFLDHRFTIPNNPSRQLDYMQCGIPILAATDTATDIKQEILTGRYGWWCESRDETEFVSTVKKILAEEDIEEKGKNAYTFTQKNNDVTDAYRAICEGLPGMHSVET